MYKSLGYDGYVFNRISWTNKDEMRTKYGYTFEYATHDVMPDNPDGILCHILEYHYGMVNEW